MGRPTIADVAAAAGVSISTVDRVLNARSPVRRPTAERVLEAAEAIGFYASGVIRQRIGSDRPAFRFGFLLQQSGRPWYASIGETLAQAARDTGRARIDARIEYHDELAPEAVAAHMLELGGRVDALAVVAAAHPRVTDAIEQLHAAGVPVVALISELSAPCGVGYVGLDNWKVGRTSAWAFHHLCREPGAIATLVGSHRYRSQEQNEMGFRSYFREKAPRFRLLEPMISFEDRATAAELTREAIRREPNLAGLYISGGGITGVLDALRETGRADSLVAIGYEMMDATRAAMLDGTLDLVLSHPLPQLAASTVAAMVDGKLDPSRAPPRIVLPFDIYTPENL